MTTSSLMTGRSGKSNCVNAGAVGKFKIGNAGASGISRSLKSNEVSKLSKLILSGRLPVSILPTAKFGNVGKLIVVSMSGI